MTRTAEGYRETMDTLVQALRTAVLMASIVSDEDLDAMDETIRRDGAMRVFTRPPVDFGRDTANLELQTKVVKLHRDLRALIPVAS